jgi:hypothetical protein
MQSARQIGEGHGVTYLASNLTPTIQPKACAGTGQLCRRLSIIALLTRRFLGQPWKGGAYSLIPTGGSSDPKSTIARSLYEQQQGTATCVERHLARKCHFHSATPDYLLCFWASGQNGHLHEIRSPAEIANLRSAINRQYSGVLIRRRAGRPQGACTSNQDNTVNIVHCTILRHTV